MLDNQGVIDYTGMESLQLFYSYVWELSTSIITGLAVGAPCVHLCPTHVVLHTRLNAKPRHMLINKSRKDDDIRISA